MGSIRPLDKTLEQLVQHVLIEPEAHIRLDDVQLQERRYAEYHTHPLCQWAHVVGTPAMIAAVVGLLATVPLGPVDLALPVVGLAAALYCRVDLRAGLICGGLGLVAWALCVLFAPPLWLLAVLFVAGLLVQTFTHLLEPVPPPWSDGGVSRPLVDFLRQPDRARVALGVVVMTLSGLVLEAWAIVRIPPYLVLFVLGRSARGLRP